MRNILNIVFVYGLVNVSIFESLVKLGGIDFLFSLYRVFLRNFCLFNYVNSNNIFKVATLDCYHWFSFEILVEFSVIYTGEAQQTGLY